MYLWISFNMEEIILKLKGGSLFKKFFFILKCSSKQSLLRNIRILKKCASEHFNHKLAPVPPQRSIILGTIVQASTLNIWMIFSKIDNISAIAVCR